MMLQCGKYICVIVAAFMFLSERGLCEDEKQKQGRLSQAEKNRNIKEKIVAVDPQIQPDISETTSSSKPGECLNYNLKVIASIEYYSCCGGLRNSTVKKELDHLNIHCNPSRLRYAELRLSKTFDCKGSEGQTNAKKRCSERWGWVEEPESCWIWSECFAGACAKEAIDLGSSTKAETAFCGDGRCDANFETFFNCPIDCCQFENPTCVAVNNTCPEACCGESHCCNGPDSAAVKFAQTFWMTVLGILAGLLFLINIVCCCCCYCCYSKCCKKAVRRYSHIDIEMPKSQEKR